MAKRVEVPDLPGGVHIEVPAQPYESSKGRVSFYVCHGGRRGEREDVQCTVLRAQPGGCSSLSCSGLFVNLVSPAALGLVGAVS